MKSRQRKEKKVRIPFQKKSWIILAGLLCLILLSGFRFGYNARDEWEGNWYGWYQVLEGSGSYEERTGEREDCIAVITLPGAYKGNDSGFISFYDQKHPTECFAEIYAFFSKQYAEIDEGGLLEGEVLQDLNMTLLAGKDLELENVLWGEGSLKNQEGSLKIRFFLMPEEAGDAWKRLQEDKGKLTLSYEELKPAYYESCYLPAREKTGFSVEAYFKSLHPLSEDALRIDWARNMELEGIVPLYRMDHSPDFLQLALQSEVGLYDFSLSYQERILFEKDFFAADSPMVLQLPKDKGESKYEIRYRDMMGREYGSHLLLEEGFYEKNIALDRRSGGNPDFASNGWTFHLF